MPEDHPTAEEIAALVETALAEPDLTAFADLLDPNVQWGAPDDVRSGCHNRDQILSWYRRGRDNGVRAQVTEVVVVADKILIGLKVIGNQAEEGAMDRWQVLTVRTGRVVDIPGFEDRSEAASRAGLTV